jgi:HEAT repeat protein
MSDDKYGPAKSFDLLTSRGLTGKREYVRGLEQRRDAEALSLLVECLCDESWYLRELAEDALLRIGPSASEVLLPLLEQGLWFTRRSAARVLGRFASRAAVPGLLRLGEDANETVAAAARDALVAIAHGGGAIRVAQELHTLTPGLRRHCFDEIAHRDRAIADRIDRMLRNEELMSTAATASLDDASAVVRASEEGLEWEVLTGPANPSPRPDASGGGRAGNPSA